MTDTPKCWTNFHLAMEAGVDRVILYGPPGTGKTYAGLHYGDLTGGAHRLICTDDMTNLEVTGGFLPSSDGTFKWHEGAGIKAWKGNGMTGGRLVVDEIDKAGGDVMATLLAILDSEESAEWENPETGELHRPKPGFSAVMTTNVENMNELEPALLDRFPVRIRINEPHPDALRRLSLDLQKIARSTADAGDRRISLRSWTTFDEMRKKLGSETALDIIFGENAPAISDAIKVESVS